MGRTFACLTVCAFVTTAHLAGQDREFQDAATQITQDILRSGKKTVAFATFVNPGYGPTFSDYVADTLSSLLVSGHPQFGVATRKYIAQIMAERGLRVSAEFDPLFYQKLGKLTGAEAIICGSYEVKENEAKLNYQLLDVSNGKILGAAFYDIPRTKTIDDKLSADKSITRRLAETSEVIGLIAIESGSFRKEEDDELRKNIENAKNVKLLMSNASSFVVNLRKELGIFLAKPESSMQVLLATADSAFYREETDMTFNGSWDHKQDAYRANEGLVALARKRLTDLTNTDSKIEFKYFNTQFRLPLIIIDDTYCYLTVRLSPNEASQSVRLEFKDPADHAGFTRSCSAHFNKLWGLSNASPQRSAP